MPGLQKYGRITLKRGYAAANGPKYVGITGEAFLAFFPFSRFAVHLGPTIDAAFANRNNRDYIQLGIPEFGITGWI